MNLSLEQSAVDRLETLRQKRGETQLYLRVTVDGGGCQGFEYSFDFETAMVENDLSNVYEAVGVLTDPASMAFLEGASVAFVDELIGAKFVLNNPNASSSCGCGTSFNVV